MSEKRIVEAHNLTVVYGRKPALWNVDFTLPPKQVIGIMGPNGSGKSTLLGIFYISIYVSKYLYI